MYSCLFIVRGHQVHIITMIKTTKISQTFITPMNNISILPEIGMSKNSVQAHQLHQKLTSVVPASWLHAQGQRGSIVAEEPKKNEALQCSIKNYISKRLS